MVMGELSQEAEVLVIGSGPGGYAAAFRAADLGLDVTMVDTAERPGGVCLHRGCIPSKTLLFLAEIIHDARRAGTMGVHFGEPQIDLARIRAWKEEVIDRMAGGLETLGRKRGVQVIRARARFESSEAVRLHDTEISHIKFRHAVVATGSRPVSFPGVPFRPGGRVMDSTGALALADIPGSLLVLGGGYVGLELGTVYATLGSRVTVVELGDRLLPALDRDMVQPLQRRLKDLFEAVHLTTKVSRMVEKDNEVTVTLEGSGGTLERAFERVLIAAGRRPNTADLGLENTGVEIDDGGFVRVDDRQRTANPRIFAAGDVTGGLMLAHKAAREGKVAAEVIAGRPSAFDARAIPAVVYTDPQIAWCGLTEQRARAEKMTVGVQRFPWKYSARATTMGATEGLTKLVVDPTTQRILGVAVTGRDTEGLISEAVLAIEMGALAEDMAGSIHPHPTLSETESETAEIFLGSATHILSTGVTTRTEKTP